MRAAFALALSVTAFVALPAQPATAGMRAGGFQVGFEVGGVFPAADLASPGGDDRMSSGLNLGGYMVRSLTSWLSARAEVGFGQPGYADLFQSACAEAGASCDSAELYHYGGGIQVSMPAEGDRRLIPYGFFLVGGYNFDPNIDLEDGPRAETHFGIGLGGGLDWRLHEAFGVGVSLHAHRAFPGDDSELFAEGERDLWYTSAAGGVFFRF